MTLFALSPTQLAAAQIALAVILAITGTYLLLPRPRGRSILGGIAILIASGTVLSTWIVRQFGNPMPDAIASWLFGIFSTGALGFGVVVITQRNPARGAIAFAFVIFSTSGLFLLLAAPFLMAATIIVYAGAIVVTFLFVLMLSHATGPSDENDRTREPFLGSLAGFSFCGLVLFTLFLSSMDREAIARTEATRNGPGLEQRVPAPIMTIAEADQFKSAAERLGQVESNLAALNGKVTPLNDQLARLPANDQEGRKKLQDARDSLIETWLAEYSATTAPIKHACASIRDRLTIVRDRAVVGLRNDEQAKSVLQRVGAVANRIDSIPKRVEDDFTANRLVSTSHGDAVRTLHEETLLLSGMGELPARNVANIGYTLFSDHLLTVELTGTLLLVAAIGAITIAQRRGPET